MQVIGLIAVRVGIRQLVQNVGSRLVVPAQALTGAGFADRLNQLVSKPLIAE